MIWIYDFFLWLCGCWVILHFLQGDYVYLLHSGGVLVEKNCKTHMMVIIFLLHLIIPFYLAIVNRKVLKIYRFCRIWGFFEKKCLADLSNMFVVHRRNTRKSRPTCLIRSAFYDSLYWRIQFLMTIFYAAYFLSWYTLSQTSSINLRSWDTLMIVPPYSFNARRITGPDSGEKLRVGSSKTSTSQRARFMPMKYSFAFCPPDSAEMGCSVSAAV